jgi:hypothetical protein
MIFKKIIFKTQKQIIFFFWVYKKNPFRSIQILCIKMPKLRCRVIDFVGRRKLSIWEEVELEDE